MSALTFWSILGLLSFCPALIDDWRSCLVRRSFSLIPAFFWFFSLFSSLFLLPKWTPQSSVSFQGFPPLLLACSPLHLDGSFLLMASCLLLLLFFPNRERLRLGLADRFALGFSALLFGLEKSLLALFLGCIYFSLSCLFKKIYWHLTSVAPRGASFSKKMSPSKAQAFLPSFWLGLCHIVLLSLLFVPP